MTREQLPNDLKDKLQKENRKLLSQLKDPNLVSNIIDEIHKGEATGNVKSILILLNKIFVNYVIDAKPESSNLVVLGLSGAGKDIITRTVCKLVIAPSNLIHRTSLSDKALHYFGTADGHKDFNWFGKVLYLEDPIEETIKGQAVKTLASGRNVASTVIDKKMVNLEVKGKPVMIITSFLSTVDREGVRRWDGIKVDESKDLTASILSKALSRYSGRLNEKKFTPNKFLGFALQRKIKRHEVIVPYAEALFTYLPLNIKARTDVHKLINCVQASAILHQYQRENKDGKLIANFFDYAYGKYVYENVNEGKSEILNSDEEELINVLAKAEQDGFDGLSIAQLERRISRTGQWIRDQEDNMKSKGLIEVTHERMEEANNQLVKKIRIGQNTKISSLPTIERLIDEFKEFQGDSKHDYMGEIKEFNEFMKILENYGIKPKVNTNQTYIIPLNSTDSPNKQDLKAIESLETSKKKGVIK